MMKIVHVPINVANVAHRLARGQRLLGHDVTVYSRPTPPYHFPADVWLPSETDPISWNLAMLSHVLEFRRADVIHIHGGIWPSQVFYPFLRGLVPDVTIAIHYHGGETRSGSGLCYRDIADVVFYTPRDIAPYHPKGIWLPQPVDIPFRISPLRLSEGKFTFGHFSTSEASKGTKAVIELFEEAFGPGLHTRTSSMEYRIETDAADLLVFRDLPYRDVGTHMSRCDAVIEQVTSFGIHGTVAVEAMAKGIPVVASINRSLYSPYLPIIQPTADHLNMLTRSHTLRESLGSRGRQYARNFHSILGVALTSIEAYLQHAKV